jgi:transposase
MTTLSIDLRERILKAYDKGGVTREDVAGRFDVSLGMVKKLLQQRRRTSDIGPRHRYSGRKPKITDRHKRELRRLVGEHADMTLEELREAIGVDCSLTAIHYALVKMGLSYKKRHSSLRSLSALTSGHAGQVGRRQ